MLGGGEIEYIGGEREEDKPQFVGIRETKVAENQLREKGEDELMLMLTEN